MWNILVAFSFLYFVMLATTIHALPSKGVQSGYYVKSLSYSATDTSCTALPIRINYFTLGTCHIIRGDNDIVPDSSVIFSRDSSNSHQLWQSLYNSADCSGPSTESIMGTLLDIPDCTFNKKLNYYQKHNFYVTKLPAMNLLANIQYIIISNADIVLSTFISTWYVFAFAVMTLLFSLFRIHFRGKLLPIRWEKYWTKVC